MKLRALVATGLVAVAAIAPVMASQASQQAQPTQPIFKSGVDVIRLDVQVVDAAGKPITDLRQDEIEVLEDGRPLPVVFFQRVTEPAESYVDAALRAVTAEVSSNDAFPRGHLYILIFDQQHITAGNEVRARVAAEEFIRTRVRPSDRVALYAVPGPGPQIGFTADKTRALASLSSIQGSYQRTAPTPFGTIGIYEAHRILQGDEVLIANTMERLQREGGADFVGAVDVGGRGGGAGSEDAAIAKRLLRENAQSVVNQSDAESRQFLQRLTDVIEQFREIEGRKTVILFSEGFHQDNLSRELESVAAAAAESYAVFYTFDLNRRSGAAITEAYASDTTMASEIASRIAPLGTLAAETNGMMVIDAASRTSDALNTIANQAQDYYLVGFTPSERARSSRGKYQRLSVRTSRPGARASARTGYVTRETRTPADRRRAIDSALQTPFVQQSLRVDYTTYVMKGPSGNQRVVLTLNTALPVRSALDDKADVVFVARDVRDGRVVASGSDTIALPVAPAAGSPLGTGTWQVQFDVPPGSFIMRAVVREPGGLTGSADRRIDVRPLAGPDVAVSDLVLGSALGGLQVRPRAYTGDGLSGVLESYGRTGVQLEGLDVKVELRREDGTAIVGIPADLQAAAGDDSGMSRRALFMLPLTSVPPGNYLVHAVVRARGEIVGERTRQVEVLAGNAPAAVAAVVDGPAAALTVSPIDIVRGDLGQRYIGVLAHVATGTPSAPAAAHAVAGRWEEAALQLQRQASDPGFAAQGLLGLAMFVREDYAAGAAALTRAFEADKTSALTAFFLGWAREGAGDPRGALSAWRSAAHIDPTLVSAHLALADGYLRLANRPLAIQALKAGLVAIPASLELQTRLAQLEGK
ncbi:MAG: VWA domain-containing protein [Acidobacteriota bacterium]|nr:VWA domain-containing protein [Acidobacteriota bacterium]